MRRAYNLSEVPSIAAYIKGLNSALIFALFIGKNWHNITI